MIGLVDFKRAPRCRYTVIITNGNELLQEPKENIYGSDGVIGVLDLELVQSANFDDKLRPNVNNWQLSTMNRDGLPRFKY